MTHDPNCHMGPNYRTALRCIARWENGEPGTDTLDALLGTIAVAILAVAEAIRPCVCPHCT